MAADNFLFTLNNNPVNKNNHTLNLSKGNLGQHAQGHFENCEIIPYMSLTMQKLVYFGDGLSYKVKKENI